jgi:hypothetical protein
MKSILSITLITIFLSGCATFISKEEKLSATNRLLKNAVHAAATNNKSEMDRIFSEHQDKYGNEILATCAKDPSSVCAYELYKVKQTAEWNLFVQTERCAEYLRERQYEASNHGQDGYQRCTSELFSPFASFESLKVDVSPITKIYDVAAKKEKELRAKEAAANLQKEKDDEEQAAAADAAEVKQQAEALAFSKTQAGKLKSACEAYKEADELLKNQNETKRALKEQGPNDRQIASTLSSHSQALAMSANRGNEFKKQYKEMTGKEINWKRDCK